MRLARFGAHAFQGDFSPVNVYLRPTQCPNLLASGTRQDQQLDDRPEWPAKLVGGSPNDGKLRVSQLALALSLSARLVHTFHGVRGDDAAPHRPAAQAG